MSAAALVFLGIVALAPIPRRIGRIPVWIAPTAPTVALAIAAVLAAYGDPVKGFGIAATAVLTVAAAAFGGVAMAPTAFRIAASQAGVADPAVAGGPLRGGLLIGVLERIAVAVALLAAKGPEGIAIVMAVKGLARYPELRAPNASEQFIIGTFSSVLWAVAVAGVGRGMLS